MTDASSSVNIEHSQLSSLAERRRALTIIGTLQGVTYWLVYYHWPQQSQSASLATIATFVAAAGTCIQFAWSGRDHVRMFALATALGSVFALVTFWVWSQIPLSDQRYRGDSQRIASWLCASFVALYAIGPYLQIYQDSGRLRFPYGDLFRHSWCNFFIGGMGFVHAAVFWMLIELWAGLFKLIGIDFFSRFFNSTWFATISLATLFGYGVAKGREDSRVIETARKAVLAVFRALMPLLATIGLLFLATLPFTGVQALWATRHASHLLLTLIGTTILFFNAVFEDGSGEPPYSFVTRRIVEAALLALPIFSAISLYSLRLRIQQYGFTPQRVELLVIDAVTSLYSLGYAVALIGRRRPWMTTVRSVNVALSLVVIGVALLTHTPALDPLAISARNQYARLASGLVDAKSFDYASLRFHLGHAGYAALLRLEQAATHPQLASIRAGIEHARSLNSYGAPHQETAHLRDNDLQPVAGLQRVPDGLGSYVADRRVGSYCAAQRTCLLFPIDLDADGDPEYCIAGGPFVFGSLDCYAQKGNGWIEVGNFSIADGVPRPEDQLDAHLRRDGASPIPPHYSDVRIGERIFRLRQ